jgi:ribosomal protein S16
MIKLVKNKKVKQECNAYALNCSYDKSLIKLGNYDQKSNTLRLNFDKYLVALSKGDKTSRRVTQVLEKVTHFNRTKKVKIKFKGIE